MTSLYGAKAGVNASSAPPLSSSSTNWTAESPPPEASITSLTFSRWNVARFGVGDDVDDPEHQTGRGEREMPEDQRRSDAPTRPVALLQAAVLEPETQHDGPAAGGKDPRDQGRPLHGVPPRLLTGPSPSS